MSDLTEAEFLANMADPEWRLRRLYKIMSKSGEVITFDPNEAQLGLIDNLWLRNVILKARQRGFSTLIQLMGLDMCLFNDNIRAGVIAQDLKAAKAIFRDKIKFAYERLPPMVREFRPLKAERSDELEFNNNSTFSVGTSMRSGTLQFLHVSEFGKICAKYPDKAREVLTGSLPTVDQEGFVFIESTAEGPEGKFYEMCQEAKGIKEAGKELTPLDMRFHFHSWWDAKEYELEPRGVVITDKDHDYFDELEAKIGRTLSMRKRAWYVKKRSTDFSGDDQMMKQEYPSTPEEAFEQSTEGTYYAQQFTSLRTGKRIIHGMPFVPSIPVNTFWDIGNSDGTAIWFHQKIGPEHRFIRFYEAWGEPYSHFVIEMQKFGYIWGRHYLPHDAEHERQGEEANKSPKQMLEDLGLKNVEIVPRVEDVNWGIQQTRDAFPLCYFDETNCHEGLVHLEMYRKQWNERTATWGNKPRHDVHSEGADSFRQFGQALANGLITGVGGAGSGASAYKRKAVGGYKVR